MILNTAITEFLRDSGLIIEQSTINDLFKDIYVGNYVLHIIGTCPYLHLKQNAPSLHCYKNHRFKMYNGTLTNIHDVLDVTDYISKSFKDGDISIEVKMIGGLTGHLNALQSSNNIRDHLNKLSGLIGNVHRPSMPDPAFGSDINDVIDNFVKSVYIWNTFIEENNKLDCSTVAIDNWEGGTHVPIQCERASYQGYHYLGELASILNHTNDDLNKIELALLLSNAWNESGRNIGLFNVCLQTGTPEYDQTLCPCDTCVGYDTRLVGRGLLQLSNPSNYIPVAYVMNKMATTLRQIWIHDNKNLILLDNLPTAKLYPPLWGQMDPSNINYIKPCSSAHPLDTSMSCAQVPVLQEQIQSVCDSIPNKDYNIYSRPQSICETSGPLSILTSLIYYSANTVLAVKEMDYSFKVSACSVNQGGYLYPIPAMDLSWIKKNSKGGSTEAYPIWRKNEITSSVNKCLSDGLEGGKNRYDGFIIILDLLFPKKRIPSEGKWSITLNNKLIYQGDDANYDASLNRLN
jgi:hypothetical protein